MENLQITIVKDIQYINKVHCVLNKMPRHTLNYGIVSSFGVRSPKDLTGQEKCKWSEAYPLLEQIS